MLFDMTRDFAETTDISSEAPEVAAAMKKAYETWFDDVSSTRGYDPPRIFLGTEQENPVTLTRQDWRGPSASWDQTGRGYWEIDVRKAGSYAVRLRFPPTVSAGSAVLVIGQNHEKQSFSAGTTSLEFSSIGLTTGSSRLEAFLDLGGQYLGVHYVDVERLEGESRDW